jgi:fermentation-respiration switch protein FrsA (DUF1100 family)
MQKTHTLIAYCLLGLLLAAGLPAAAAAQSAACSQEVFVQTGDTLSIIAGRTLGSSQAYARIVEATNAQAALDTSFARIDNPNVIAVGWKLCIPAAAGAAAIPTAPDAAAAQPAAASGTGAITTTTGVTATTTGVTTTTTGVSATLEAVDPPPWADRLEPDGPHPLTIEYLRRQSYPGSPLVVEQTLAPGSNYNRYLVAYRSEGLKINALLTVPAGAKPATGWPVVVFNHGYIPPEIYRPTERYIAYVDAFARNGYIVLRPDYRGHADSEGEATGAYGDPGYTIDVLNAVASIKQYPDADPARIGLWGHSMGGYITVRAMVVDEDIRAGVVWAGVVASYPDLLARWSSRYRPATIPRRALRWREALTTTYGTPEENPEFWASISANSYVSDLSGPVQLHHGAADESVPLVFSDLLYAEIQAAGKPVEYYTYPGDDHNIAAYFSTAMDRSVAFMDTHVKGN